MVTYQHSPRGQLHSFTELSIHFPISTISTSLFTLCFYVYISTFVELFISFPISTISTSLFLSRYQHSPQRQYHLFSDSIICSSISTYQQNVNLFIHSPISTYQQNVHFHICTWDTISQRRGASGCLKAQKYPRQVKIVLGGISKKSLKVKVET